MASVADLLTWSATSVELGVYLDVTGADLAGLELVFEAAIGAADKYLNDITFVTLPELIKLGVFEWVRKRHESPTYGASMEKTGDLQKQWAVSLLRGDDALHTVFWRPHRVNPGF